MKNLQKLVICEDHPIYANGMEEFLGNYFEIVGNFKEGYKAVSYLEKNEVDFLLLDLNLLDTSGIKVIELLQEKKNKVKIIVVTMYNDKILIEKCRKANIHAYCSKHIANSELLEILYKVDDGLFLVDSNISKKLKINNLLVCEEESFTKKTKLTGRECELVELFSKGMSSKEVANKLFVSVLTINTHKKNIYRKLEINSIAELVTFYYENF